MDHFDQWGRLLPTDGVLPDSNHEKNLQKIAVTLKEAVDVLRVMKAETPEGTSPRDHVKQAIHLTVRMVEGLHVNASKLGDRELTRRISELAYGINKIAAYFAHRSEVETGLCDECVRPR